MDELEDYQRRLRKLLASAEADLSAEEFELFLENAADEIEERRDSVTEAGFEESDDEDDD